MKTDREIIGERIASARGLRRLTQPELAKEIGTSVQTVSNWEVGKSSPNAEMLRRLCISLSVSCDYILGISNELNYEQDTKRKIDAVSKRLSEMPSVEYDRDLRRRLKSMLDSGEVTPESLGMSSEEINKLING